MTLKKYTNSSSINMNYNSYHNLYYYKLALSGDGKYMAVCLHINDEDNSIASRIDIYEKTYNRFIYISSITEKDANFNYKISLDYYGNKLTAVTTGPDTKIITYDISIKTNPIKLHEFKPKSNDSNIIIYIPTMSKDGYTLAVSTCKWVNNDKDNKTGFSNYLDIYKWDTYSNEWIFKTSVSVTENDKKPIYNISLNDVGSVMALFVNDDDDSKVLIYTLDGDNYIHKTSLYSSNINSKECFGHSIDLNGLGDIIAISSLETDKINNTSSNKVYVYRWNPVLNSYEKIQTINNDRDSIFYGSDVCLSSDSNMMLIGSIFKSDNIETFIIDINTTD